MKISQITVGPATVSKIADQVQFDSNKKPVVGVKCVWMGGQKNWKVPKALADTMKAGDQIQLTFQADELLEVPNVIQTNEGTINYDDIHVRLNVVVDAKVARSPRQEA